MKIFSYKTILIIGLMIILSQIGTSATSITSQGIITTGNMTADNVFLAAHIFSHNNKTQLITSINVWQNITWGHEASLSKRITHTHDDATNITFTIVDTGTYKLQYFIDIMDSAANPASHAAIRIMRNNTEIQGSAREADATKQNSEVEVSNTIHAELTAGDIINFEFVADDATVSVSTAGTFGDQPEAATITMARIS